ncbi:hypothetical protein HZB06_02490 [Candidatus Wolfebacteria bacterium]|nr:hypothetical protein [Candidatus Wolfebacteria bacterium]
MANFLKILIFFLIIVLVVIYFFIKSPFFTSQPREGGSSFSFFRPPMTQKDLPAPVATYKSYQSPVYASTTRSAIQPAIPSYLIPEGLRQEQLSPFFNKIKIGLVSISSWTNYPSTVRLYSSSLTGGEKINISGWKLKSNRGEILINRAVEIYSPQGLNNESDIVLSSAGIVNIYDGENPISRNLRLNKCAGYLQNFYDFKPPLQQNCPAIPRSSYVHLSGECQTYVMSLGSCQLPKTSFVNILPGNEQGNNCRMYLNAIGYNACFNKHRYDNDFLSNEWRIWIGGNISDVFDQRHDRIRLFDKNGLLADEYVY